MPIDLLFFVDSQIEGARAHLFHFHRPWTNTKKSESTFLKIQKLLSALIIFCIFPAFRHY